MNKKQLKKFIIEFPENENPDCPDTTDQWFEDLYYAIEDELGIEWDEELVDTVDEILDTL